VIVTERTPCRWALRVRIEHVLAPRVSSRRRNREVVCSDDRRHLLAQERVLDADALEKNNGAVIAQTLAEKAPELVRAAAESFRGIDNLTA
jgi:hypothetical protein